MSWFKTMSRTLLRGFHFVFTFMVSPKSVLDHEFGPIEENERFKNQPKGEEKP